MIALDTLEQRWSRLRAHIDVFGPDKGTQPTVLLFHGCGGIRAHLPQYAEAAAGAGVRAVVVDSFAARGWSRNYGMAFVCTGAALRGPERAGDVLAATWGAIRDLDADPQRLMLAGWSHGGWSIMDLMTMPLEQAGEAGLADPTPEPLAGVKGLFLAYPYGGIGALSRNRPWVRGPRTFGLIATRDRVTNLADSERLYLPVRACGAELEIWRAAGAHCFDEPGTPLTPLRYDAALAAESLGRFKTFVARALAPC